MWHTSGYCSGNLSSIFPSHVKKCISSPTSANIKIPTAQLPLCGVEIQSYNFAKSRVLSIPYIKAIYFFPFLNSNLSIMPSRSHFYTYTISSPFSSIMQLYVLPHLWYRIQPTRKWEVKACFLYHLFYSQLHLPTNVVY